MKKPIQVIMLPTEDKKHLLTTKSLYKRTDGTSGYDIIQEDWSVKRQYLYITISQDVEPIKEGDYIKYGKRIVQIEEEGGSLGFKSFNEVAFLFIQPTHRKIIATTNPKLTIETELDAYYRNGAGGAKKIPQIQQSFLKKYCDSNGESQWEVEYKTVVSCHESYGTDILVENDDNTINITPVKEKMYSRSEVESLLKAITKGYCNDLRVDNWIRKNL